MALRVMIWNVQNFGQGTVFYNLTKGANSSLLAQFIGRMAAAQPNLGVIFLMEVMPGSLADLTQVMDALNAVASGGLNDWMFDWIKGSVGQNNPAAPVNAPGDLAWRSGERAPRQEGYAVFWRNGHPDFEMMHAETAMSEGAWRDAAYAPLYDPGQVLSLSLTGRDVTRVRPASPRLRPVANFNTGGAPWGGVFPTSCYPDVGRAYGATSLYYNYTRRPAYAVIRLTAPGAQDAKVLPIMAFHAPSHKPVAGAGTFVAAMSRELYALKAIAAETPTGPLFRPLKFIAGGDFNIAANAANAWEYFYGGFLRGFNALTPTPPLGQPYGGANASGSVAGAAGVPTTVQIKTRNGAGVFNGPPITGGAVANYKFSAIDNGFYRGFIPSYVNVWDMVDEVMGPGGGPMNAGIQAGIQGYMVHLFGLAIANGGSDPDTGPQNALGQPVFDFFGNYAGGVGRWNDFFWDVCMGQFQTPRAAAVFYRMFVSDHLPILVQI